MGFVKSLEEIMGLAGRRDDRPEIRVIGLHGQVVVEVDPIQFAPHAFLKRDLFSEPERGA